MKATAVKLALHELFERVKCRKVEVVTANSITTIFPTNHHHVNEPAGLLIVQHEFDTLYIATESIEFIRCATKDCQHKLEELINYPRKG